MNARTSLALASAAAVAVAAFATPADAFWVARGWRGGVAVGGVRPPVVARDYYYPACLRCAPVYPAGAAVAGAAIAGAAVGAAAATAAAAPPPVPAPTPTKASTSTAAAPAKSGTGDTAAPNGDKAEPAKPAAVVAASSAADTCAKGLPADSKMIYDATVKNMKGLDTIRDTVVAQTRAMVMSGKLSQSAARPAAEAAGTCLKLLANS